MLQILLIFIIICCSLIVAGTIWLIILRYKFLRAKNALEQNPDQQDKYLHKMLRYNVIMLCVLGSVLGLTSYTAALFSGIGEFIIILPFLVAAPFFFWAWKVKRKGISQAESPSYNWVPEELSQALHIINYTPKSSFAEKNTLELQAFGNDSYMTTSTHICATYKNVYFEYYQLDIPYLFEGQALRIDIPTPYAEKIFIISRDFTHSQLLTRSGVWKEISLDQNDFSTQYALFAKAPEHAASVVNPELFAYITCISEEFSCPQSYYLEGSSLYALLASPKPLSETHIYEQEDEQIKQEILQKNTLFIATLIDSFIKKAS